MLLSEGQMSDHKGAAMMLDALPPAKTLIGDRGYDAGWFPPGSCRTRHRPLHPVKKLTAKYRSLTTGRSTTSATRSRTCSAGSRTGDASIPATTAALTPYFSAICIAATVIFWIKQ